MMQFDVNVSGDKLLFIVTQTNKQKNPDAFLTTRCQQCSNVQVRAASAVTDILLMTAGTMGIYRDFMVAPLDVSVF